MTAKTLPERLRNTPNWQRESFEHWKTATCVYDRAPFEAADEIERLTIDLENTRAEAVLAVSAAREAEQARMLALLNDSIEAAWREAQAEERAKWRTTVQSAAYHLEKARVLNGMGWHYNALHPMFYRPALDMLREVLDERP